MKPGQLVTALRVIEYYALCYPVDKIHNSTDGVFFFFSFLFYFRKAMIIGREKDEQNKRGRKERERDSGRERPRCRWMRSLTWGRFCCPPPILSSVAMTTWCVDKRTPGWPLTHRRCMLMCVSVHKREKYRASWSLGMNFLKERCGPLNSMACRLNLSNSCYDHAVKLLSTLVKMTFRV